MSSRARVTHYVPALRVRYLAQIYAGTHKPCCLHADTKKTNTLFPGALYNAHDTLHHLQNVQHGD